MESAWEWKSPTCPRLAAPPRPPLRATPRVSLLRRVLLAASCCIPSAMPLGADEGEWAAVERRGPHLWASGRPLFMHDSFRGGRRPRGAQRVPHLGLQRRRVPRAAAQALLLRRGGLLGIRFRDH